MHKEYYETLDVARTATTEDIARAFKLNALRLHPSAHSKPGRDVFNAFNDVCEAYEVLSDAERRSVYDVHGLAALKSGFYNGSAELVGCYEFKGDAEAIFTRFFGTPDFHAALVQHEDAYGRYLSERNRLRRAPPADIVVERALSLLEVYRGAQLSVAYEREVVQPDGVTTRVEPVSRAIRLPRGYDCVMPYVLPREGNQKPGFDPANVVVRIVEQPAPRLARRGADLVYTHTLSLVDSLMARPFEIVS